MKPASFEYRKPASLDEAAVLLRDHGEDAKILAGGQTLVPMLNFRLAAPAVIVDSNICSAARPPSNNAIWSSRYSRFFMKRSRSGNDCVTPRARPRGRIETL